MSFVLYLSQKSLYKKHHVKSLPNLLKKRGYMADKKQFIDYFGAQVGAAAYAQGRPTYPESFIKSLIDKCLSPPKVVLDIGCGTGQATFTLAKYAPEVVGMDPSKGQVAEAIEQAKLLGVSNVRFVQGGAEELSASGIPAGTADLITAAQCAHWFDLPVFFNEADKLLTSEGVVALFCYTRPTVANVPHVEAALEHLYTNLLGPHWPSSRKYVDNKYMEIVPPKGRVERIEDAMEYELSGAGLLHYLATWSALQVAKKTEPDRDWLADFKAALNKQPADTVYHIVTPIYGVVAYK